MIQGDSGARWEVEDPPFAAGPHALVYRAMGEDGLPAALKVARLPGRDGAWVEDEAEELRAWGQHPVVGPFVVPVWDVGRWEGRAFHVTTWCPLSLEAASQGASRADRLALAGALVSAVLTCREAGLVHPNLHPRNVFVERTERGWWVFLSDPGERPAVRAAYSTTGLLPSTSLAAPEQAVGWLPGDDTFSLAACVFAVLVGHAPEAPLTNALRLTPRGRRWMAGVEASAELHDIVDLRSCEALTPEDRAAVARLGLPDLEEALEALLAPDRRRRSRDPRPLLEALTSRPPRRSGAGVALGAALAVVLAVPLLVGGTSAPPPRPRAPDYAMVRITPGEFSMGSRADDPWHAGEELAHDVRLTRPFLLGIHEVTQAQWRAVTGTNPTTDVRMRWGEAAWGSCATYDGFDLVGEDLPAVCVSWRSAVELANAWSERAGLTPAYRIDGHAVTWDREADGYRLPTEAEWEYAARAGSDGPFGPAGASGVCAFANLRADEHCDDGRPGLLPVGSLRPNAWGLHDMLGNAQEWVWDRYGLYDPGLAVDPIGPDEGELRVNRGGSWWRTHRTVAWRSSDADWVRAPTMGLRLARNAR